MIKIPIKNVVAKHTKFIMNGIEVKIKVEQIEGDYYFIIGLYNPKSLYKYDNYFTKVGIIEEDYVVIHNLYIEHPPYRFFSSKILVNNSLDEFYLKFSEALKKEKKVIFCPPKNIDEKEEGFYFQCFVNLGENKMSERNADKIEKMLGQKVLRFVKKII